jgi:hypothetical protein
MHINLSYKNNYVCPIYKKGSPLLSIDQRIPNLSIYQRIIKHNVICMMAEKVPIDTIPRQQFTPQHAKQSNFSTRKREIQVQKLYRMKEIRSHEEASSKEDQQGRKSRFTLIEEEDV